VKLGRVELHGCESLLEIGLHGLKASPPVEQAQDVVLLVAQLEVPQRHRILNRPGVAAAASQGAHHQIGPHAHGQRFARSDGRLVDNHASLCPCDGTRGDRSRH